MEWCTVVEVYSCALTLFFEWKGGKLNAILRSIRVEARAARPIGVRLLKVLFSNYCWHLTIGSIVFTAQYKNHYEKLF